MEILVSFMLSLSMMSVLVVVFGTLAVQEILKAYRKRKSNMNDSK